MNASMDYLDGNVAAGDLNRIFAFDITAARGQCAHCGAKRYFAEAHLYVECPGMVARCSVCGQVLLRLVNTGTQLLVDLRGMSYLALTTAGAQESKV